jgi:hypothetical protein
MKQPQNIQLIDVSISNKVKLIYNINVKEQQKYLNEYAEIILKPKLFTINKK